MGSSNSWERATKLLGSALKMVVEGSRTVDTWADHLQIFVFGRVWELQFDKSAPALQPFNRDEFRYVESGLKSEHYPVRGHGIQSRRFKLVNLWEVFPEGHNPTTQELLDLANKGMDETPDFVDTKAFHQANPNEATDEHPIISLCGSVVGQGVSRRVACFDARSVGWRLYWRRLGGEWSRYCRLLVACK